MSEEEKKSRATIAPPAKKKNTFLPTADAPVRVADNMKEEKIVGMTFNMPFEWHTQFKVAASLNGLSMKELLVESFDAWLKKNGQ